MAGHRGRCAAGLSGPLASRQQPGPWYCRAARRALSVDQGPTVSVEASRPDAASGGNGAAAPISWADRLSTGIALPGGTGDVHGLMSYGWAEPVGGARVSWMVGWGFLALGDRHGAGAPHARDQSRGPPPFLVRAGRTRGLRGARGARGPGLRRFIAVRRCSAFTPSTAVMCRRSCPRGASPEGLSPWRARDPAGRGSWPEAPPPQLGPRCTMPRRPRSAVSPEPDANQPVARQDRSVPHLHIPQADRFEHGGGQRCRHGAA